MLRLRLPTAYRAVNLTAGTLATVVLVYWLLVGAWALKGVVLGAFAVSWAITHAATVATSRVRDLRAEDSSVTAIPTRSDALSDPVLRMLSFLNCVSFLLDRRTARELFEPCKSELLEDYIRLLSSCDGRLTRWRLVGFLFRAAVETANCFVRSPVGRLLKWLTLGILAAYVFG